MLYDKQYMKMENDMLSQYTVVIFPFINLTSCELFLPYFICDFFRFNYLILFHSCYCFCFLNSFLLLFVFFSFTLAYIISIHLSDVITDVQLIVFVFLW